MNWDDDDMVTLQRRRGTKHNAPAATKDSSKRSRSATPGTKTPTTMYKATKTESDTPAKPAKKARRKKKAKTHIDEAKDVPDDNDEDKDVLDDDVRCRDTAAIKTPRDDDKFKESLRQKIDSSSVFRNMNPAGKHTKPFDTSRPVKVGLDFAGVEVLCQSFRRNKIKFKHVWSCDNDPACKAIAQAKRRPPKEYYDDVTSRPTPPYVDVYGFTPPCQCFSAASNDRQGSLDESRGILCLYGVRYVIERRPRVSYLEEVKTFLSDPIFPILVEELEKHDIDVRHKIMDH